MVLKQANVVPFLPQHKYYHILRVKVDVVCVHTFYDLLLGAGWYHRNKSMMGHFVQQPFLLLSLLKRTYLSSLANIPNFSVALHYVFYQEHIAT
jgi:hypothetical protein